MRSTLLYAALALLPAAAQAQERVVVLTALPAVYSVAATLAEGTRVDVRNVPEDGRPMSALVGTLAQRPERYADEFASADAVITIGKLWRDDPLFTVARMSNVRIVDIDATKPWSTTLEGVSVAMEPEERAPWVRSEPGERSPALHFWLSPANGARMAEIVAADLARLVPQEQGRIERNLAALRQRLLDLKLDYELRLAELADVTVFALASEFVYLTTDLGIYVDGYFTKQDIDWTDEDLAALSRYLGDNDIGVVIHKWEPDERIRAAIGAGGAELAVLDPIDRGIVEEGRLSAQSYLSLLSSNLESLYQALRRANP